MFIYHFNRLIRNRILWGIFALMIAVAFVSVDSCFRDPDQSQTAGTLNGKKITTQHFDQIVMALRGFGRYRDNETAANVIDKRAWQQLAARSISEKNGLKSTSEEVRSALREVPTFQGANGFDLDRYRMILADQGITPAIYESVVAHQLAMMKCSALVESATWIAPMEIEDELAALTDIFTVHVATLSNRFATVEMRLTEQNLKAFYEENKASFALPERVAVRYIAIPVTNFLPFVKVPEDDLQEYYDSHTEKYTRTTTNAVTEPIPYSEVREKILSELQLDEARYCASTALTFKVYGTLGGTKLNALEAIALQDNLQIRTSPLFGLEDPLVWVDDAKAFTAAAFELEPEREDARYGIVKTDSTIYVIERAQHSPAHTPTYEAVLNELRPRAMEKARSEAFQSYVKELRADIRQKLDGGKSFMEAAQASKLNVSTAMTYTVSNVQAQQFEHKMAIAYGAMKLQKGELSEALPVSVTTSLLVYMQNRQVGDALTAEMMRAQVRTGLARRYGSDLFAEWLTWNLGRQAFKPMRPLLDDEAETEIKSVEQE